MTFINAKRQAELTLLRRIVSVSAQIPPARRSRATTSCLALAILLLLASALCGAGAGDYPKSPVPSKEEFEAIEKKANAGDAESQRYMGVFYANGDLVQQDYAEAAKWYCMAAEQGNARAQRNLATLQ